jgi:hypothetical protein
MDAHTENDPEFRPPPHCVAGTAGQQKPAATLLEKRVTISSTRIPNTPQDFEIGDAQQILLEKQSVDCFTNPNLPALLEPLEADRCIVYGVVTEICVKNAAMGLLKSGRQVTVVTDAVRSLDDAKCAEFLPGFRSGRRETGTQRNVRLEIFLTVLPLRVDGIDYPPNPWTWRSAAKQPPEGVFRWNAYFHLLLPNRIPFKLQELKGLRVKELAAWLEAPWEGEGDREICRVAPLEDAGDEDLRSSPTAVRSNRPALPSSLPAGPHHFVNESSRTSSAHRTPRAVARAIPKLHPHLEPPAGIHPTAVIGPGAVIGKALPSDPWSPWAPACNRRRQFHRSPDA